MSNQFLKLRRSAVPGKIPDTGSLALGEIALNTYDGLAFMKKSGSNGEEVVTIGNSSGSFSGSFSGEFTGSLLGTSSWAYNASTASTADNFFVRGNITGSNALFTGTVTAQTLVVQTITSSVIYSSGSNIFGNKLTDTQQFTGSVTITGSLTSANVNLTGSFSGSISNLDGATNFIAKFDSPNSVDSSVIYQSASHIAINETNFTVDNPEALYVFQTHPTSINVLTGKGNLNNYLQNNIQNTNQGISASSDVVATANNGNENSNYIDMGINSENYNQNFIGGPNDAYLYSIANNLHIGNANDNGTHVALFVGGVDVDANTKIQLNANNRHIMSGSFSLTGSLNVKQGITGSLFGTSSWAVSASRALSGNGGFSGSFTGSFFGNGAGLTNISASSVVGLNLSLISSGSVTASTDPAYGFRVNSNTQISGSTQITGSLGLTGSFSVSGSLGSLFSANVDTMVFTGSFFQSGSIQLTGSLNVTRGGITGSLFGTSSWAVSASHAPTSLTASFAVSSSLAQTASLAILAPAYTTTASFTQFTSSYYADSSSFSGSINILSQSFLQTSSSYVSASGSLSTRTTNLESTASVLTTASASFAVVSSSYASASGSLSIRTTNLESTASILTTASASFALVSSSYSTFSQSYNTGSFTGSFTGRGNLTGSLFGTSSWALNAITASNATTASFVLNAVSASFAATASSADTFVIRQDATASNLLVNNTITAQTLVVQTITSSVDFVTGSTRFGTQLTNTHQFTGSVSVTGSLSVNNSPVITDATFTPTSSSISLRVTNLESTASVLTTASASFAQVSASYSQFSQSYSTGSFTGSFTGNLVGTASWANNATSASFATTASYVTGSIFTNANSAASASYAFTASFALNVPVTSSHSLTASYVNPLRQNVILSGALDLVPTADPDPTGTNTRDTYLFVSSSNTALGNDLYFKQDGNITKWKWVEGGSLNTGILFGGNVTYSGSFVYISSGSGIIVDYNASTGSEINPIINYVNWGPLTSSITNIATTQVTYLYIDSNGAAQQQSIPFTPQQYSNALPLGAVGHFDNVSVSAFAGIRSTAYAQPEQANQFIDAFGPLKIAGYSISAQPSSLRYSVGSGTSFVHGGFYDNDPNFPSIFDSNSAPTASIVRCYISGSNTVFDTNNGTLYTTINPGFYNNVTTGVTSSLSNNKWTIQRVFTYPPTNTTYVYYGQNVYDTLTAALDGLSSDTFSEGATQDFTTLIGYLVVKSNTSDLSLTENKILAGGLFRAAGAGGAGGAVAAASLDDLSDVSITSPTNGQALIYNSGTWINGTPLNATSASLATTASFVLQAVSASFATSASLATTASYVLQSVSASFATTASNATTASFVLNAVSASFASTASFVNLLSQSVLISGSTNINGSLTVVGSSNLGGATFSGGGATFANNVNVGALTEGGAGNSWINFNGTRIHIGKNGTTGGINVTSATEFVGIGKTATAQLDVSGSTLISGSFTVTGSVQVTGSLNAPNITGSLFGTSSWALNSTTASFVLQAVSASFAATASSADNFLIRQNATASNLLVNNTITAQTLVVQTITSSVDFVTGSTKFGTQLTDTHQFTGSVTITGSLSLNNDPVITQTPYNTFSSSIQSRVTTLETASGSLSTRVTNLESTASVLTTASASLASDSGSNSIRLTNLESTSSILINASASLAQDSGSNSTRFINLESTASVLTTASASFALVSSSYSNFSQSYNTGSFTGSFTGFLYGTSSWAISSSQAINAQTASLAISASYFSASITSAIIAETASFVTSSNVYGPFGSDSILSASYSLTASYALNAGAGAGFPFSGSAVITGSLLVSESFVDFTQASYVTGTFTGTLIGTASWAENAITASYILNAISASYAATASSADDFFVRQNITASNLLVNNTITAQTLVVQTVTSSVIYSSGSNIFGNDLTNIQEFTGSISSTGSVFFTGLTSASQANVVSYDTATGQLYYQLADAGTPATASYALTASAATEFTIRNTLALGSSLSDYATVASSVVGSNNLFTQAVGLYTSAFFKYTVTNGSNARSGEVMSVWNGSTVQFTDNSTLDVGSTTPVTCSVSIVGSDVQFNIQTNTSGWAIKALATYM